MARIEVWRSFFREIWHREYWWAEFASALPLLAWAVWAFVSPETVRDRPAFDLVREIMPLRWWELFAAVVSLTQLYGLLSDNRGIRALGAFFAAWVQLTLIVGVALAVPSSLLVFMASPVMVDVFALLRHAKRAP